MASTAGRSLLLLCYGEGGHHAQATRLVALLEASGEPMPDRLICVTDRAGIGVDGTEELTLLPLRLKHAGVLAAVPALARGLWRGAAVVPRLLRAIRGADRVLLVSLGPAFVALPALLVRATGGYVVHVETWSRIRTRSLTGRIMRRLADAFLVQHRELLEAYPKAHFVGRL